MQRPLMTPQFGPAPDALPAGRWMRRLKLLATIARVIVAALFWRPWGSAPQTPFLSRMARGLVFRAAAGTIFFAFIALMLVYGATHPRPAVSRLDPASLQIYYDPVAYVSADQTRLEGWLVPVLDARKILDSGDDALRRRHPAVVLAPSYGGKRQDLLPLIAPLHDREIIVLVSSVRGDERSNRSPATFGLREADDIASAVQMLRRRPFVDPNRIAIIASGPTANAALLVAQEDPTLTLVLEDPLEGFDDAARRYVLPSSGALNFLTPVCRLGFNVMFGDDAGKLDLSRYRRLLAQDRVLMLDRNETTYRSLTPDGIDEISTFLCKRLRLPEDDDDLTNTIPPARPMIPPASSCAELIFDPGSADGVGVGAGGVGG